MTETAKDVAKRQKDKPLTDGKPTGHPTNDRFDTETAHHDVQDDHSNEKSKD